MQPPTPPLGRTPAAMPFYPPHAATQKSAAVATPPRLARHTFRDTPARSRWGRRVAVILICLALALAVTGMVIESFVLLSSMRGAM